MEYPKTVEEMLAVCIGCGLCRTGDSRGMRLDDGGFLKPADMKEGEIEAMAAYCPSANSPQKWPDSVWGDYLEAYLGWSANENIRFRSSSGGVTTGVLCGLLDQGLVDCVLCVKAVPDNPAGAQGFICRTPCEVEECCGSRYVTCSPLLPIEELFRGTVNFAVVGRPCDIKGLRLYFKAHPEYRERCVAMLSFFCAGTPSSFAASRLLNKLGVAEENIESLRYRGCGWPGKAVAKSALGDESSISYEESWGGILGRDISSYCRFCFDGVGDCADIASGDAWLLNSDGTGPDFSEHPGRNVVFARTERGKSLLALFRENGSIVLEPFSNLEYLDTIQKFQASRRGLLYYRTLALKFSGRRFETAPLSRLAKYKGTVSKGDALRVFLGTWKRVLSGKIKVY